MNAAFLLVTTAWLAGAEPIAAPAAAPKAAPAAAAPVVSSCNGGCDACCDEGGGHHFLEKLRGLFHRGCGDSCGCECAAPAPHPAPTCDSGCDTGCHESLHDRLGRLFHRNRGCDTCGGCGATTTATCDSCDTGCHESLHDRLGRLFHRNRGCGCESDCCSAAAPAPGAEQIAPPKEAPKKMPAGDKPGKQAQTLQPIPPSPYAPRVETETHSPFELNRRYESRVDHAPDYSWLTGQLFYVHADGGLWVLRYAPLWKEDPNGGSVVLARDLRMESYREGDLVTIHGEILNQRSSVFLGGPLYRAGSIQLVEHRTE